MNRFIKAPICLLIMLPSWSFASELKSYENLGSRHSEHAGIGEFSNGDDDTGHWAVDKLRKIALYHPIDKSHISFAKSDLPVMLNRLTAMLRELSCKVNYREDSLSASCITMEQINFHISFYISREDPESIILELQRRAGDSLTYNCYYARPILDLVNLEARDDVEQADNLHGYRQAKDSELIVLIDRLILLDDKGSRKNDIDVAMEIASNLVLNDRHDAIQLGLESFETLTNPSKTGLDVAQKIVRTLLRAQDERAGKVVKKMLGFLIDEDDSNEFRFQALKVWVNTWNAAANDLEKPLSSIPKTLETFGEGISTLNDLVVLLMQNVKGANTDPHLASLSLKGIYTLSMEFPILRSSIEWQAVEEAYQIGLRENVVLLAAASNCMQLITN